MTATTTVPRPEIIREPVTSGAFGIVEKPLSTWERITNVGAVRKFTLLVILALIWEVYARMLNNPLLFPTFSATVAAFGKGGGSLLRRREPLLEQAPVRGAAP